MNKLAQLAEYDFHDSLLEEVLYDKHGKKVLLRIDLCNWKQEWYSDAEEETSMLTLTFRNVSGVVLPGHKLNSDEIIEFELLGDNGVRIIVFNDIEEATFETIIYAETVEVTK